MIFARQPAGPAVRPSKPGSPTSTEGPTLAHTRYTAAEEALHSHCLTAGLPGSGSRLPFCECGRRSLTANASSLSLPLHQRQSGPPSHLFHRRQCVFPIDVGCGSRIMKGGKREIFSQNTTRNYDTKTIRASVHHLAQREPPPPLPSQIRSPPRRERLNNRYPRGGTERGRERRADKTTHFANPFSHTVGEPASRGSPEAGGWGQGGGFLLLGVAKLLGERFYV